MREREADVERIRAGVNCAVLLERHPPPWQLDRKESTRRCLKYRRGAGEILLVTHEGRGWWDPLSTAKGNVIDLLQYLAPTLNFRQVCDVLRSYIGASPSYPEHTRISKRHAPSLPVQTRWDHRKVPTPGTPGWRYLTEIRQLPGAIVTAAGEAGALKEGPAGSAWFAHRDTDGRITGIEMRGPEYRGFSPGGEKTVFRLAGSALTPRRVVVTEAPIDAMSLASIENLSPESLYIATGGGIGPGTITAIKALLKEVAPAPGATVVIATDADRAGCGYAKWLREMSDEAGVRSERLMPPDSLKDWNEMLMRRGIA
jgi:hypothetical protein